MMLLYSCLKSILMRRFCKSKDTEEIRKNNLEIKPFRNQIVSLILTAVVCFLLKWQI